MGPGTQLGSYEIVCALGKGGMGEVWKARDKKPGREVVERSRPLEFASARILWSPHSEFHGRIMIGGGRDLS